MVSESNRYVQSGLFQQRLGFSLRDSKAPEPPSPPGTEFLNLYITAPLSKHPFFFCPHFFTCPLARFFAVPFCFPKLNVFLPPTMPMVCIFFSLVNSPPCPPKCDFVVLLFVKRKRGSVLPSSLFSCRTSGPAPVPRASSRNCCVISADPWMQTSGDGTWAQPRPPICHPPLNHRIVQFPGPPPPATPGAPLFSAPPPYSWLRPPLLRTLQTPCFDRISPHPQKFPR